MAEIAPAYAIPLARLHTLCHDPRAPSYRVQDGQYQHRCSICRVWLPAEQFGLSGLSRLRARCRSCDVEHHRQPRQANPGRRVTAEHHAPAPAPVESPAVERRPHLAAALDAERTCRSCITGLGVAFEPLHVLQLALELERVAGAAYARERELHGAQPRLPLFERAAPAPEVPRD